MRLGPVTLLIEIDERSLPGNFLDGLVEARHHFTNERCARTPGCGGVTVASKTSPRLARLTTAA